MGKFKEAALIFLLSKKTIELNGNTKAKVNFTVNLENGENVYISKGQDIVFEPDRFGFGTKAFENNDDDNLFSKVLKTLANGQVSGFQYIEWKEIESIV